MAHVKHMKKNKNEILIDAEFRIKVEKIIEEFSYSDKSTYEFTSSLTSTERAFVHNVAPKYNLKTKSHGKGASRKLSLYKLKENEEFSRRLAKIDLSTISAKSLKNYLNQNEWNPKNINLTRNVDAKTFISSFLLNPPCVPEKNFQRETNVLHTRRNLPIYEFREDILSAIDKNRITLIQGSTGSGKTTQIPQYILDDAYDRKKPCRILCTQPRRISAVSSAERVCFERGIQLSTSVGYQIRLDSKISAFTNCIFLTPGIFLRYLMSGQPDKLFSSITHILIDEAHERNKENDFLLTAIKENFNANPHLKLLIMSATMNTSVFTNYFGESAEISIVTKQFHVDEYYLEDVLKIIGFHNEKVAELNHKYQTGQLIQASQSAYVNESQNNENLEELDEQIITYLDEIFESMSCSDENPETFFDQFFYLVQNENISINHRHSQTKMTALMIAVGRGWIEMIEKLLKINADPSLKVQFAGRDMNSFDIAEQVHGEGSQIKEILLSYAKNASSNNNASNEERYNKALLNIYQDTVLRTKNNQFIHEEAIDLQLIVALVEQLHHGTEKNGAILIFLTGYDDILQLSNLIEERNLRDYTLFMLHSSMKTNDQKNVFKPTAFGKRKIILSTNIAESSITIDDILYVIDSGREKQKSYDAITHCSSLRVQWISKASANQRKGRAGRLRNGIVYRMYSRDRFNSMLDVTIPELLRTSLTEICLQTKLLVNETSSIEAFLQKCICLPSIANIRQSIKYLKSMGALDKDEKLTLLGYQLAGMPVEAKFGKMLIFAIIFRCLDPILNLVSILSLNDQIFILPTRPSDRYNCVQWRKNMAGESLSDHFVMLKVFQNWWNVKKNGNNDRAFCQQNFLSSSHMDLAKGIRQQVLNHLQNAGLITDNLKELNANSGKWTVLKAVIASGLYPFVARIENRRGDMYTDIDRNLQFHVSSVLCNKKEGYKHTIKKLPADWVAFEEKIRIGRKSMVKCNTLVNSLTICLVGGTELKEEITEEIEMESENNDWEDIDSSDEDEEEEELESVLKIDNLIKFKFFKDDADLIYQVRARLNHLVLKFLSEKNFSHSQCDKKLIDTIAEVLEREDIVSGFPRINCTDSEISHMPVQNWRQNQQPIRDQGKSSRPHNQRQDYRQEKRYQQIEPAKNRQQNYYGEASTSSRQQHPASNNQNTNVERKRQVNSTKTLDTQKFIILNINSKKFFENLAQKIVTSLEDLKLKVWMYHKIRALIFKRSFQVSIIFFSSKKQEFLGYGNVVSIDENHPLQFQFRSIKSLPLKDLGCTAFVDEIKEHLSSLSFYVYEPDSTVGNSLILYFQS